MNQAAAVFSAIQHGDQGSLARVIAEDPELAKAVNPGGVSALMWALYMRRPELARLLLDHGADLDLFAAAALGDAARLRGLASDQADRISAYSPDGWTGLALAAHFNQVEAAQTLLDLGADLQARSRNANGNTPLHAALAGLSGDTAALLLAQGADVNAADANGWTPLHLAAASGRLDLARLVLNYHPFVDPENADGASPLALAQSGGHQEIVELLRPHSAAALG
ncbi:MAG TPA: ankyrin repeat domain-containing protein [Chloroflexota bacterium]|nr:ankyrin repeat domain-containing protein [Chloroflexota bacterium]